MKINYKGAKALFLPINGAVLTLSFTNLEFTNSYAISGLNILRGIIIVISLAMMITMVFEMNKKMNERILNIAFISELLLILFLGLIFVLIALF